jgi:hypothetical protein
MLCGALAQNLPNRNSLSAELVITCPRTGRNAARLSTEQADFVVQGRSSTETRKGR